MRLGCAVAIVACVGVFTAPALADTIIALDFDDLTPLTHVNDQYVAWGIRFTTQLLDTLPNIVISSAALSQSHPNVLASAFQYNDGVISFSFLPGASSVSLNAVSVESGVTVRYLGPSGIPLFEDIRPGAPDFQTPLFFTYSSPLEPITAVVLEARNGEDPDSFAIDDLTFSLIPEPASLFLFSPGLLLAIRRRRRHSR